METAALAPPSVADPAIGTRSEAVASPSVASISWPEAPASLWRLSVEDYHRMIDAGILGEDDPVELLEGWLVTKMSKNTPHSFSTRRVREQLTRVLPAGWYADSQEPITTGDSEPEPDGVVVRGEGRVFLDRHPGPLDVGLVVEVADSSLARDRGFKGRIYARAGIPVYWIVNLPERVVEVYSEPSGPDAPAPAYGQRQDYGPGEELLLVLDGREVGRLPVAAMLP